MRHKKPFSTIERKKKTEVKKSMKSHMMQIFSNILEHGKIISHHIDTTVTQRYKGTWCLGKNDRLKKGSFQQIFHSVFPYTKRKDSITKLKD